MIEVGRLENEMERKNGRGSDSKEKILDGAFCGIFKASVKLEYCGNFSN